jgi:subtilisin-like proprotein convertase family protein/V8-like Glu-specific endopeptidase
MEVTMKTVFRLLFTSLLASQAMAAYGESDRVIYGDDNRRDVVDPSNEPAMVETSKSTVVLVKTSWVRRQDDTTSLLPPTTFAESSGVCEDEPFRDQPNPGFCSGFLVAPDVIVTAGHCIKNQSDCDTTAFVFDFYDKGEAGETSKIENKNLYFCRSVIAQELSRSNENDFSVVRIDRKVEDRSPLKFRSEGKVDDNTSITVIGHPSGLPTKISGGAWVRENTNPVYFQANLDTYGGNSGSAVVAEDGMVEGILVRGEQDFEVRGFCRVSKRCDNDDCRGEDVTRATMFAPFVPNAGEGDRPRRELAEVAVELNQAIPDHDSNGLTAKLNVREDGIIAEVSVKLELEHSYPGDLTVKLMHPDGTVAVIRDRSSDDGGPLEWVYGYDGRVALALRKFREKPASGTWKLILVDTAQDDIGTLVKASLKIRVYDED